MRTMLLALAAVGLVFVPACGGGGNPNGIECIEDGNCNRDPTGKCVQGPSGRKWCSYSDTTCPSGLRYDELDVGDGVAGMCVVDEPPDAGNPDTSVADASPADASPADASPADASPIDAGTADANLPALTFDIAYSNEWDLNLNDLDMPGWLVIVNTGSVPFNLNTLELRAISDDHVAAAFSITPQPQDFVVNPGFAAGWTHTLFGTPHIIDSGLVTEPRVFDSSESNSLFTLRMVNAPVDNMSMYDINVSFTIAVAGVEKPLSMLIHIRPFPQTWSDPRGAIRVAAP